MNVELKSITPKAEENIVEIARVSSSRENKTENPEGLIGYLIKNKHWSPFEMSNMVVEIVTSKAIAIQLLRHRSFSFQEFSQRYAKVENFEPIQLRKQAEKNRQSSEEEFDPYVTGIIFKDLASIMIKKKLDEILFMYNELLETGVAKECARMILPMCTQTTLYMQGTIRSWIHFLALRDDAHAQLEAQLIAKEIKKIFKGQLPVISKALGYE